MLIKLKSKRFLGHAFKYVQVTGGGLPDRYVYCIHQCGEDGEGGTRKLY